jgi:hypothetical protein
MLHEFVFRSGVAGEHQRGNSAVRSTARIYQQSRSVDLQSAGWEKKEKPHPIPATAIGGTFQPCNCGAQMVARRLNSKTYRVSNASRT